MNESRKPFEYLIERVQRALAPVFKERQYADPVQKAKSVATYLVLTACYGAGNELAGKALKADLLEFRRRSSSASEAIWKLLTGRVTEQPIRLWQNKWEDLKELLYLQTNSEDVNYVLRELQRLMMSGGRMQNFMSDGRPN